MDGESAGTPIRGRLRHQQVHIGAVWVSLMEPDVGAEIAFNQWYGDDHFYAGGMNLPGIFAGRRWLATREHQALRISPTDSIAAPAHQGCFLHLNFFALGQVDQTAVVLGETIAHLAGEGRMYVDTIRRRHVFSRLQPYVGAVYRAPEDAGPLDIHALDHPFGGVALEVVRARDDGSREALVSWLLDRFVPQHLESARAEMCLVCLDADLPQAVSARTGRIPTAYDDEADRRVTLLWFVEDDAARDWTHRFAPHAAAIEDGGLGVLEFAGPFIPTVPGTDRHVTDVR